MLSGTKVKLSQLIQGYIQTFTIIKSLCTTIHNRVANIFDILVQYHELFTIQEYCYAHTKFAVMFFFPGSVSAESSCLAGQYLNETTCTDCVDGTYCPTDGLMSPIDCPAGAKCPDMGKCNILWQGPHFIIFGVEIRPHSPPPKSIYFSPIFKKNSPQKEKQSRKIECFLSTTGNFKICLNTILIYCTQHHEYCLWKLINIPLFLLNNSKFPNLRAPVPVKVIIGYHHDAHLFLLLVIYVVATKLTF